MTGLVRLDHEGRPSVDFTREVMARGPLSLDLGGLRGAERTLVIETWRERAASEYVSARVFASLVPSAMAAGLDHACVTELLRMADEEIDHGIRCARVLAAFGEAPVVQVEPKPLALHADALSPVEAVLRDLLDVSCVSETVAVALVGSEREHAATLELRDELERILADEVGHARFGWRLVGELVPSLNAREKRRLGAYLATVFRERILRFSPYLLRDESSREALGLGAPAGPTTFRVFHETVESITVPRLEALGIAASRAWTLALESICTPEESRTRSDARRPS